MKASSWQILAAGFLCMAVAAGIGWVVFPVYMTAIERDLGTSRSMMGLAVTVWALVSGAISPLIGIWTDKYGARRVMLIGTIGQICVTFLLGRITALWQLYALFVAAALANTANTTVPVTTLISQWFDEKRGTAMAIALLGNGLGGFIVPIAATGFMNKYGWRGGYTIFGFVLITILPAIAFWVHSAPKKTIVVGSGEPVEATSAASAINTNSFKSLSLSESARTRSFWFLAFGDFLISLAFTSVIVHMVAFATSEGVSQEAASAADGVFWGIQSLGIIGFGMAADKLKIRWMMVISYGAASIAMIFLFRMPALLPLYAFAIIFGVTGGGRSALWPLAIGHCFGTAQLGAIIGWLNIPFMIGNAIGPYMAGYIFDVSHSYRLLFTLCIFFSLFAAASISRMRNERAPLREKARLTPEALTE